MSIIPNKARPGDVVSAREYNQLLEYVKSITPQGDKKTVRVNRTPGGAFISAKSKHSSSGGNNSGYTGMWKVTKKDDDTVTVGANRGSFSDIAIVGLNVEEFGSASDVSITESSYVCLKLTNDSENEWSYDAVTNVSQDNDTVRFPLAYVTYTDSAVVSLRQIQYGIIHYPARYIS